MVLITPDEKKGMTAYLEYLKRYVRKKHLHHAGSKQIDAVTIGRAVLWSI